MFPSRRPAVAMSPPSGSPPLCVFYLQNACSRGDQCRYSHGPPQSEDHKTASPSPSVLCQFFSQGSCRFGGQCRFYHPADSPNDNVAEVTSWRKPNTSTNNRTGRLLNIGSKNTNPIVSPVMKHSAFGPCKFFSQGRCMKGEACSFTHSALAGHPATPLPLPPDLPAMDTPVHTASALVAKSSSVDETPSVAKIDTQIHSEPCHNLRSVKSRDVERMKLGCRVVYGAGASIHHVTTAFESRFLVLSDLPLLTESSGLLKLVESVGDIKSFTLNSSVSTARVEYADASLASSAIRSLDGAHYAGGKISARYDVRAVEDGLATLRSTKVKVSWFAPSCIAWAHYDGLSFARKQAEKLNGKIFNGRKISTSFQTPHRNQTESFSVEIKGLPPRFVIAHLKGFCDADALTVGKPTYQGQDRLPQIRQLLSQFGSVDSIEALPSDPLKTKLVAFAQFSNAEAAERAVSHLHGSKQTFLGRSPVWLEHIHSIRYNLPYSKFSVLKSGIDVLRNNQTLCKLRYYEKNEDGEPLDPVCIRVYGTDPKALGKAKIELEHILNGELLVKEGQQVWDEYLGTPEGLFFLRIVSTNTATFVQCEVRLRTVRLFGSDDNQRIVKTKIFEKLEQVEGQKHVLLLERSELRMLVTGGLQMLEEKIGADKLVLDVVRRTLTIRGDDEDIRETRKALSLSQTTGIVPEEGLPDSEESCPVCFCDITGPILMLCGHVYCRSCLQHLLRSTPSSGFVSMHCIAEKPDEDKTGSCGMAIPYDTIRELLSGDEEDKLLEASFLSYINARPEFHYCSTPDCQMIYRTGSDGTVLRCPSCLARVCSACHVEFHEGLDCASYRDNLSGGDEAYRKWREQNNVKACPKCKTDLEKNGGCNHMTCPRCRTHMCWVCMQTFSETDSGGGVYAHMRSAHGSIT